MESTLDIFVKAIFSENMIFAYFLGMCSYLAVSKTVKTAVLANRDHHTFPIQANFVGISLATTVKEHISYEEIDGTMSISLS